MRLRLARPSLRLWPPLTVTRPRLGGPSPGARPPESVTSRRVTEALQPGARLGRSLAGPSESRRDLPSRLRPLLLAASAGPPGRAAQCRQWHASAEWGGSRAGAGTVGAGRGTAPPPVGRVTVRCSSFYKGLRSPKLEFSNLIHSESRSVYSSTSS